MELFNRQLGTRLHDLGDQDVRPRHFTVFSHVDLDGTRPTDLARRAGMTRQSMGELVAELVGGGYLEQQPDPTDRRSKIVLLTPKGLRHVRDARGIIQEMDDAWEHRLGSERMRELRWMLEELTATAADAEGTPPSMEETPSP
jgi:DNA-binding MarR family transcriptional regulator